MTALALMIATPRYAVALSLLVAALLMLVLAEPAAACGPSRPPCPI